MSSLYVRNWFRSHTASLGVPYYETVNSEQNPTDPVWVTYEFNAEFAEVLSFCGDGAEEGVVDVIVSSQPGTGDAAALSAVEAAAAYLVSQNDATGRLVILGKQPPDEYSDGSADRTYRVIVGIEYRFYR
jgi:hypothetical protein